MWERRLAYSLLAGCLVAATAPASAATVTFFDGDFDRTDWDNITAVVPIPGRDVADGIPAGVDVPASFVTIDTPPTGGNPDAYRAHRLNWVRYGERVFAGGVYLPGVYDPALDGAIQSLTFSADLFVSIGDSFRQEVTDIQVVVRQAGVDYYSVPMLRFFPEPVGVGDPTVFQSFSIVGLVETNFDSNPLAFVEGDPAGLRPDFSATAEALQFGYVFSNTRDTPSDPDSLGGFPTAPGPNDPRQFTYQAFPIIDNWRVELNPPMPVTPVPVPAALPLLATGLLSLAWLRRCRRGDGRDSAKL